MGAGLAGGRRAAGMEAASEASPTHRLDAHARGCPLPSPIDTRLRPAILSEVASGRRHEAALMRQATRMRGWAGLSIALVLMAATAGVAAGAAAHAATPLYNHRFQCDNVGGGCGGRKVSSRPMEMVPD